MIWNSIPLMTGFDVVILVITLVAIGAMLRYRHLLVQANRENALRQSEPFFQSALDALSAHIAILDETGTILAVNAAWQRFASGNGGLDRSAGVGMNYLAICDAACGEGAQEAAQVAQGIRHVLTRQRECWALEYSCHSPNELRWFLVRVTRFQNDQRTRLAVTHENITERKKSEKAQRQSEALLRQIAETMEEFFWISEPDGPRHLYVSPAYESIWGRSCESLYDNPRSWIEAIHPEDREIGHGTLETLRRGEASEVEYRIIRSDGAIRWVRDRAFPILDSNGCVYRLTGIAEDITAKKEAATELSRSYAHFHALIENTSDIICVIDADGIISYYSPSVERIMGYHPEDLIGKNIYGALHPEDVDEIKAAIAALIRHPGSTQRLEYQARHCDGSWRDFEAMASSPPDGLLMGDIVVNARDITERQQAEEERQRLEVQLRQSQKMEAIGTLAGGIAHDFNNVLGAIFINTEMSMALVPANSGIEENLQNILSAAGRARDLVQQILTFGRQVETQRQPVRLSSIIQNTLTLLRASLPTTIDIRQSLPDTGDTILADPTQLHQIILNLCVNAEHAMRETGGALEINVKCIELDDVFTRSQPELQPGRHVRLMISDSGHGMTSEVMARIFDPYFTTKGVREGTGMGLAMVHGMVAGHGGAITVKSRPGAGTTFTLYFPCIQEPVGEHPHPQEAVSPGAGRIMVVDDEPMLVNGMKVLLTRFGYEVSPYTSSQEALAAFELQPERFDLVITDQTMPQITGEILARELRQCRPDIPIILCTGFSHVINAERARAQGIDAYCIKPVNIQELTATIQNVLEQRRRG